MNRPPEQLSGTPMSHSVSPNLFRRARLALGSRLDFRRKPTGIRSNGLDVGPSSTGFSNVGGTIFRPEILETALNHPLIEPIAKASNGQVIFNSAEDKFLWISNVMETVLDTNDEPKEFIVSAATLPPMKRILLLISLLDPEWHGRGRVEAVPLMVEKIFFELKRKSHYEAELYLRQTSRVVDSRFASDSELVTKLNERSGLLLQGLREEGLPPTVVPSPARILKTDLGRLGLTISLQPLPAK